MTSDNYGAVDLLDQEREVVRRYATQLQQEAGEVQRPVSQGGRRRYELLNDLAMELAQLSNRSQSSQMND